jgi:HSP20 family protein
MMSLKDRMNQLFENVFRKGGEGPGGGVAGWVPAVDLREEAEGFVLTAELPGVPQDQINLRLEGRMLFLEGERPVDGEDRGAEHLRVERSYGSFARSFHIPAAIDESKVTAKFRLGVLEVRLPKTAEGGSGSLKLSISK